MKRYECTDCGKRFAGKAARRQHWLSERGCTFGHGRVVKPAEPVSIQDMDAEARRDVFACIAGDLPDGAYWAMAEEFSLDAGDLI